jgi:hypothetical protein
MNKIFLKENNTTFESGPKSSTFMGPLVFPEQPILSMNSAAHLSNVAQSSSTHGPFLAQLAYFSSFFPLLFFFLEASGNQQPLLAAASYRPPPSPPYRTSISPQHPPDFSCATASLFWPVSPVFALSLEPRKFSS